MGNWGYKPPISRVITLLITGRDPPCRHSIILSEYDRNRSNHIQNWKKCKNTDHHDSPKLSNANVYINMNTKCKVILIKTHGRTCNLSTSILSVSLRVDPTDRCALFQFKNPQNLDLFGPKTWTCNGQNLRKPYSSTTSRGVFRSLRWVFFPEKRWPVEPASLLGWLEKLIYLQLSHEKTRVPYFPLCSLFNRDPYNGLL